MLALALVMMFTVVAVPDSDAEISSGADGTGFRGAVSVL